MNTSRPFHLLLCALALALSLTASSEQFTATVTAAVEGDVLQVTHDGKPVKVALWGIDAPEPMQAYGVKAKQYTAAQCQGKSVTVDVKETDKQGRVVAVVTLADGRVLNQALVKAGMAWWYEPAAPKDETLKKLHNEAKAGSVGLWSLPSPIAPWEFRKNDPTKTNPNLPPVKMQLSTEEEKPKEAAPAPAAPAPVQIQQPQAQPETPPASDGKPKSAKERMIEKYNAQHAQQQANGEH